MTFFYRIIKQYHIPILIALISKILILFLVYKFSILIPNSRGAVLDIFQTWNVWDAPHYISVASFGYQKVGDAANFIILLPFFPILIYIFKFIFQTNFLISGYLVSFVATILLAVMLYKLIILDYSKDIAILAVFLLFIFPTSFFLHIPYTEAVFMSVSVSAFYFARTKRYLLSFIFISLATFTKIAGLALIPAIFAEIFIFDRQKFNTRNIFLGMLISLSGISAYLFLNYFLWGDFFYFTIIQRQHWFEVFAPMGQGLITAYQSLSWRSGLEKIMYGYGQIFAFFLAFIMSLYALIKVRFSYGIFSFIVLWISYSMSFWICMPRYILVIFPMFIVLALLSKNVVFKYSWILFSSILLTILSLIFTQYGPVL